NRQYNATVEVLTDVFDFLARVHWVRVIFTVLLTAIAVFLGIWLPARILERYTNQVALRYVWYVGGTLMLIMVYVSMYGYGHFWELYGTSELAETRAG